MLFGSPEMVNVGPIGTVPPGVEADATNDPAIHFPVAIDDLKGAGRVDLAVGPEKALIFALCGGCPAFFLVGVPTIPPDRLHVAL